MKTRNFDNRRSLRGGAALPALALLGAGVIAVPAYAQDTSTTTTTTTQQQLPETTEDTGGGQEIVVTGSILRSDTRTPSPVTTLTADTLERRGVLTVQEALQTLASNNGPALTNSFTANGAFAAGASAISLRGLSTNSSLVLFDGLRAAYYPLADDGSRNFVDLNTIPDDIIDRIEVLRDGASASYGADAIAGVVNIITKKEAKGLNLSAQAGISERGDGSNYRLTGTLGFGDLASKGIGGYISGFYIRSEALYNRQRPYPFNSSDERGICLQGSTAPADCGPDNRQNGFSLNAAGTGYVYGGLDTAANFLVRPANLSATGANTGVAGTQYQNLSACVGGQLYTLTAADRAVATNATAPNQVCQIDTVQRYSVISPQIERFGGSARVTADIGDSIEGYFEANFLQTRSGYSGLPTGLRATANTGILFPQFSTATAAGAVAPGSSNLALPVYVCPLNGQNAVLIGGTYQVPGGCNVNTPGARLNPNNPFAAAGQAALLIGRDYNTPTYNETRNRTYRAAFGVSGDITDRINFDVAGTAMHSDLRRTFRGFYRIQNTLNAIADGSFNFVNPELNTPDVDAYVRPDNISDASSDLYQIQGTLGFKLFQLPGGMAQLGVGGSVYYEAVDAPSANDDTNGPTQRYFAQNAFGTVGNRTVKSAYFEASAPIFDQLELRASGRYDSYSSGQDNFSPKFGAILRPVRQLTIRGTFSRGFRIPSFGEANALPTTGFVTNSAALFNDTYLAQYGCTTATFSQCPAYIRAGSYGQTTLASPDLEPEKSRSFTASVTFEPIRQLSFSADYFNIRKTGAITQPSNAPALQAYYTNQPIPVGYTVIADAPDINFPNARPRVAFVQSQLINANTIRAEGIDFGARANFEVGGVAVSSSAEASLLLTLATDFPGGGTEVYQGTLGNFNLTAGSGTPEWHGSWQTTLDFGSILLTGTAYYFDGYNLSAQDQGTGYKDCGLTTGYQPGDPCNVKSYITFDLNTQFKVAENFTFSINVQNLFDRLPPIDTETYGAYQYNPVQGGIGIYGRSFRAGFNAKF
ncbi:TonB-dependent receptor [uncultured Sphingomonas sp.]|uniref:TonB-dependent receptor domain-containing protein n=1 Tax=uncultured Sphingomonas sp. TaxID=158754 RepID=UPI0025D8454B|nr:TonB-dependent receptor [uncultured Sphingomonas sp.]